MDTICRGNDNYKIRDCFILFLLFALVFFICLGRGPLMVPDEARYAEIPREMIERGDFITPHLNYVKYFDKPALHYWLTALSFRLLGENEFAARFVSALSGLLGILITWHIGRKIYGRREAMLSALILGTSVGYVVQGRLNIIDMLLTFLMTATLGSFLLASREGEPRKGVYYHLFYAGAALMVLAKGLIGIALPAVIIIAYLLSCRRWGLLKEMRLPTGIVLFFLVGAPWFIIVSIRNPGFGWFFFVHEHFVRFLSTEHKRYQPLWFFIPVLMGCMFPWSCFLPAVVARFCNQVKNRRAEPDIFLWAWVVVIFVFFSLSGSKLVPYILPTFPAVALLMGRTFSGVAGGTFTRIRWQVYILITALYIGAIGILVYPHVTDEPHISLLGCSVIGGLLFFEGLWTVLAAHSAEGRKLFLGVCAISYILCLVGPTLVVDQVEETRSLKSLALVVRENARPGDMVISFDFYPQDLTFYTRRRVVVVDATGDLEYGSTQGNQSSWFIDFRTFYTLWDSPRRLFVVIHEDDIPELIKSVRTPAQKLGHKGDVVLITNR